MTRPIWSEELAVVERDALRELLKGGRPEERRAVLWVIEQAGDSRITPVTQAVAARLICRMLDGTTARHAPPIPPEAIRAACVVQYERGTAEEWVRSQPAELWAEFPPEVVAPPERTARGPLIGEYPRITGAPAHTGRCMYVRPYHHPGGGIIGMSEIEYEAMLDARRERKPFVPFIDRPPMVHIVGVGNVYPDDPRHPHSGTPHAAIVRAGQYHLPPTET